MAARNNGYFLINWTIKGCKFENDFYYMCPIFKAGSLGDSEWGLYVYREKNHIFCYFALLDNKAMNKNTDLKYRFELINSMGKILKSSEDFTLILERSSISMEYNLIDIKELINEQSKCTEKNLTVRCHLAYAQVGFLLLSSDVAFINCEAETRITDYSESFNWNFKFTDFINWTAMKRINLKTILLEINFKYTTDGIQIEISSSINDIWEHKVWCTVILTDASNNEVFRKISLYFISKCNKKLPGTPFFSKQHLNQAQCFKMGEIRVNFHFKHGKSNKLNYYKSLEENKNLKLKNFDDPIRLLPNANTNVVEDKSGHLTKNSEMKSSDNQHPLIAKANSDVVSVTDCISHLHRDLYNLLMDKTFADNKLRVNNEIIPAHKAILAIRSPVFREVFEKGRPYYIEGSSHEPLSIAQRKVESILIPVDTVDIPDVETKTLKSLIEYIYTGKISEMDEEKAMSLLDVARKFQVEPLVKKCLKYLKFVLSLGNACKLLLIADKENQEELKSYVVNFILKHSMKILSSSEWSQLIIVNNALAKEVLTKLKVGTAEESMPGSSKEVSLPPVIRQQNNLDAGSSNSTMPEPEGRQMITP
ncbi:TD and POZ domain-containing protein 1-like isoform X2 [Parasteatoda tepidariorum]|uniref:TD and POZ domain-containing protein 1-like isoform X2 n=1 Tax=Parasteatoda tepidariorum TaxID=114398 RepID=UPI001C71E732|nr:TD and POZ domain-containing protein 1-like isoform X2 [Parasteatoda tepidariorum]